MMQRRAGFTLVELLISAAIGMGVVAIAVQQLFEYFNLQALLVTRTDLRESAATAMEKIDQHLRYAIMLEEPPGGGYMGVVPKDVDHCGRLCYLDTYDIYWWRIRPNPLDHNLDELTEQMITLPAFKDEPDMKLLVPMFSAITVRTHVLATSVALIAIKVEGTKTFHTQIFAQRTLARRAEPVRVGLQEMVTPRGSDGRRLWSRSDAKLRFLR